MSADETSKKIIVHAAPNSRKSQLIEVSPQVFKIKLVSPPIDGQANRELIKLLAKHFKVHRRNIIILKGIASREKIIQINFND